MQAADRSRPVFARRAARVRGESRMGTGMATSLAAHALLVAALVWGVRWNTSPPEGVAVELWSATPRIAAQGRSPDLPPAPRPQPTPPSPAPTPRPEPRPAPTPPPPRPAEIADRKDTRKEPPKPSAADEAKARREQAAKEQAEREKAEAAKQAEAKKKAEAEKKAQAARENAVREQARKDQLARINAALGGEPGGSPGANAARSSGPSAGYAGRIKARIKPNIVFTDTLSSNPAAEVEVRVAPDGTIIGQRLTKSSGVPAWDQAVLRAVERTAVLPRDTDGRVPPVMLLTFRPQD